MTTPAKTSRTPCKLHTAAAAAPPLRVIPAPTVYKLDSILLALRKRFPVTIEGHNGIINGIQAEDGSGRNWLVKFHNRDKWMFIRAV